MYRFPGLSLIGVVGVLFFSSVRAQDTLPRFSATSRGPGKVLINWHNKFTTVTQISIQRSADSLKNFMTLITVPDPTLPENGVVDNKAPGPNYFYRLFIVLENGQYLFTPSRRPLLPPGIVAKPAETPVANLPTERDTIDQAIARAYNRVYFIDPGSNKVSPLIKTPRNIQGKPEIEVDRSIFVRKGDTLIGQISNARIRAFRDSVLTRTKDTLVFIDGDTMLIKPFVPKEVYHISPYVYTGKYGNVHISLPDALKKHYSVKFFDEGNKLIFELAEIKDASLILDKTNFLHAGWYRFELYDGEQLKEKNKLLIPKDF
jgi:hypothetical protein